VRKKYLVLILLGGLGFAVGCSSGGTTPAGIPSGGSTSANVLAIAVDGGPTANQTGGFIYPNGVFATATICHPGSSSNCVNVDHLLVDTGSVGLRILQSEVSSLGLPTVNASNGSAAYDCTSFVDGSYVWGPVESANVTLAGENTGNIPIQVISSSPANIPTSCSNGGVNDNTQSSLGANGILGVGLEPFDCGEACDPSTAESSIPPSGAYYTCSNSGCTPAFASCGAECNDSSSVQQVTHPVVMFPLDNNGVIVELPSVSGSAATVTGSLVFGIGTETNNQLTSTTNVFTVACDFFNTSFEGQAFNIDPNSCTGPGSFIDSGSNGLFFYDVNNVLPPCPASPTAAAAFYCPSSLMSLSATVQDPNNSSITEVVNFSINNAQTLLSSTNAAFSTLGGPVLAGQGFDWGLPFFYGRNVYVAIDGQTVPTPAPSPWWAF